MRKIFFVLLASLSASLFAVEKCYQIGSTPLFTDSATNLLCFKENEEGGSQYAVSLKTIQGDEAVPYATFYLILLQRARCIDCNYDSYGLDNPGSSFQATFIKFLGKRNVTSKEESGKVSIGSSSFYYRSL